MIYQVGVGATEMSFSKRLLLTSGVNGRLLSKGSEREQKSKRMELLRLVKLGKRKEKGGGKRREGGGEERVKYKWKGGVCGREYI